MNQYHIYEKIGKGKHSTVYKGRKKKTIQYHAIKSVEKSQKPRVLQEVRTMHALNHQNILKFYAWYETTNHLWLILEYCVGGDLMSLLRQDVRLPESSIHDFGRDMVVALQFLHAHSIIYCDIKPSNILLDENGRLKLGGFGLSRRLSDINKTPVTNLPPAKRGTPCYMAPELFSEGATHSTASDLWSLGCVLYECATGSPPFMDSSFNKLVTDILNKEPPAIPGASPTFSHLLSRLLDKNPATRIKWQELVAHPFWRAKLPVLPLPQEPALEAFIQAHNLLAAVPQAAAAAQQDSMAQAVVDSLRASVDLHRLSRIALSNLEKDTDVSDYTAAQPSTADCGDITLDSADAELDFEDVAEPPTSQGGADEDGAAAGTADTDRASDKYEQQATAGAGSGGGGSATPEGPLHQQQQHSHLRGEVCRDSPTTTGLPAPHHHHPQRPHVGGSDTAAASPGQQGVSLGLGGQQHYNQQQHHQPPPPPPSQQQQQQPGAERSFGSGVSNSSGGGGEDGVCELQSLMWHPSDAAVKPIVANRRIERLSEPGWDAALLPFAPLTLSHMLECDQAELEAFLTQVYRTIASSAPVKQKANMLAYFESLCSDTAAANVLINSSLTVLFVRMLRNGKLPLLRIRLASVLGLLIRHATYISDELAATQLVVILTEALSDNSERVRRRVMATLGELLFYVATQQQDSGASSVGETCSVWGINAATIAAVVRLLRPAEDEVCQHYAIKTIENICSLGGEWARKFAQQDVLVGLLNIYATTKTENVRATTASTLSRLLRGSPDLLPLMLQHNNGLAVMLRGLTDPSSKVQVSAVNMLNLALAQQQQQQQQQDINSHSSSSSNGSSSLQQLDVQLRGQEQVLLAALPSLLDHALALIRAKGVVTVMLLCRSHPWWLLRCCQLKLVLHLERLMRDKDTLVQDTMSLLQEELSAAVRSICTRLDACILSSTDNTAATAAAASGANSSSSSGGAAAVSAAAAAAALDEMYVVLCLVTSPSFRPCVVTGELIECLARYLAATNNSSSSSGSSSRGGGDGDSEQQQVVVVARFRTMLLQVLEAATQPEHMSLLPDAFLCHLMPALCITIQSSGSSSSNNGSNNDSSSTDGGDSNDSSSLSDTHFSCIRILSDCLALYLTTTDLHLQGLAGSGPHAGQGLVGSGTSSSREGAGGGGDQQQQQQQLAVVMDSLLRCHVIPLVPVLLEQEDPMPLYALKLLGGILDVNHAYMSVVNDLQLSGRFFDFLTLDHPNNNVHNIRLCRQLVLSGCIGSDQLAQLGAADKVCAVLCYAQQNAVEPFLEPVLLLAAAILAALHDPTPGSASSSPTKGLQAGSNPSSSITNSSSSRCQLLSVFVGHLLVFADLAGHPDPPVSLAAAQCLARLAGACPAESAACLLTPTGTAMMAAALTQAQSAPASTAAAGGAAAEESEEEATRASAALLQQELLTALNTVLAAAAAVGDGVGLCGDSNGGSNSPSAMCELSVALRVMGEQSPDAGVASAALAAVEQIEGGMAALRL